MSSKKSPIKQRLTGIVARHASKYDAGIKPTPNKTMTPLRRQLLTSRKQIIKTTDDDDITVVDDNPLNKAFSSGIPILSTATPRFKTKPTALNACYTPSSLYRNTKSTPSSLKQTTKIGTPRASASAKSITKSTLNDVEERCTEISNLTVAVRVRPLNEQECMRTNVSNVVHVDGNELTVVAGTTADNMAGLKHTFAYDHIFYSCDPENRNYACQQTVFESTAAPLIDRAFEGYNACLFAYGQTGSGKSYSMMGIEALDDAALDGSAPHLEAGVIPRFCYELFKRIDAVKDRLQAEIEVSYFEIYNEKIHDLLCVQQAEANSCGQTPLQKNALKVREHPIWGPYVVDLSVHPVDSYEALRNWLAVGNSQRATAATGMNDKSSRSHSIFNIVLNLTENSDDEQSTATSSSYESLDDASKIRQTRRSKISLVDLAGSERISASGANCERIREGVSINKSLLILGKVIAALADTRKNGTTTTFVPYRESVLTWLLRENLGGNSKTVMLATISPASVHIDETLATLRYACQARTIVNRVKVNESRRDKIIRELRAEVDRLKSLHNEYERHKRLSGNNTNNLQPRKIIIETSVDDKEVEALRQQLTERERELKRAEKSWMERLKEAEDQRKSELRLLKRKGLALELAVEQKQACLVNLTADPILSGTLFYIIPIGIVKIGRTRTSTYCSQPDIVLDGPLVGYHHCFIENESGKLFVTPENEDFQTFLNGELINDRQQMFHGDRLVIGGSHYFRISNPFCSQRTKNKLVDFQLAEQEIYQKREEKLRRELEEETRAALSLIELERVENERNFKERLEELELEQLKFKCNREILETERKAFEEESAKKLKENKNILETYTPSYKSTLLEDIHRIMQNPSEESLHKTQLMVKEATQRCRRLGLRYEFRQSQRMDEFGMLRSEVLIVDRENFRKAQWPTARLGVWLDIIRDTDNINAQNIFQSVDIEWQNIENNDLDETLHDSINSSKISLNLSLVKDAFLIKKPMKNFFNSTPTNTLKTKIKSTKTSDYSNSDKRKIDLPQTYQQYNARKHLTYDEEERIIPKTLPLIETGQIQKLTTTSPPNEENYCINAFSYIRDMQRSALRLKKLCQKQRDNQNEQENTIAAQQTINDGVQQIESILQGMRICLDQHILIMNSVNIGGDDVVGGHRGDGDKSPIKTTTTKSVRFLID